MFSSERMAVVLRVERNYEMKIQLFRFFHEEQGQDLIEYTLLLAFVCLAAAAIFIPEGKGIGSIWSITSDVTASAASAAAS